MAKEPFVDPERMGAVGASYGGSSVFYLAGMHGGRFKAFISHCGVFNFISWYGSTEELWYPDKDIEGPYWNMPKSYQFSPHLMADNWDTPILIITGANDFRIPYTQSMEAFQAAQLHNVPSRLLFFEDEGHWVLKPQNAIIWQREYFRVAGDVFESRPHVLIPPATPSPSRPSHPLEALQSIQWITIPFRSMPLNQVICLFANR